MHCFSALLVGILTGTLASAVLADDLEYPDYIYVDLSWTDMGDPVDCDYSVPQLRTIRYDELDKYINPHDLESYLLFRLNNVRDTGGTEFVQIAGWIDTSIDPNSTDVIPDAHAWTAKFTDDEAIVTFVDLPEADDEYSWATAISDDGIVAGMTGNSKSSTTWHKAAVWEQHGSNYQRSKIDPHSALEGLYECEDDMGNIFESCAFGVIDVEKSGGGTTYAITGGCDAGCTRCMGEMFQMDRYGMRAYRYQMSASQEPNVIDGGPWEDSGRYISHQLALSFLDDEHTSIGYGRRLMGWELAAMSEINCNPPWTFGPCGSPTAFPTEFDFSVLPGDDTEHLDFEENIDESTIPGGYEFHKYNQGILRDSYGHDVVGTTADNIACETCADTSVGCDFSSPACGACRCRAVHWPDLGTGTPEYLPLLRDDDAAADEHYVGLGIGSRDGRLQIVGATSDENSALLWQQDATRQWPVPLDLNDHLANGHINLDGLDPRINLHTLRLVSAHDVNDRGWIVGIASARYCSPQGSGPGDADACICDEHAPNGMSSDSHPRPFLLIPVPQPCDHGNSCPADFNGDGTVDSADMGILLANWYTTVVDTDLNCDGNVDGMDLGLLFAAWGPCS